MPSGTEVLPDSHLSPFSRPNIQRDWTAAKDLAPHHMPEGVW
jgi:hypothetical protein